MKNAIELLKQAREHLSFAKACGGIVVYDPLALKETLDGIEEFLKKKDQNWIIKKVPNTKDEYYVESGRPPKEVLDRFGIRY